MTKEKLEDEKFMQLQSNDIDNVKENSPKSNYNM